MNVVGTNLSGERSSGLADQQHQDANRAYRAQIGGQALLGVIGAAVVGLLGWIASQQYEMNATLSAVRQQLGTVLATQDEQHNRIRENSEGIRDNSEKIRDNAASIQRLRADSGS